MSEHQVVELTNANLVTSQSVTTNLTPNSNSVVIASGDNRNETRIVFQFKGRENYSTLSVSTTSTTAKLSSDTGNGVITFKSGLTVTYQALQTGFYSVLLDGQIVDNGVIYSIRGAVLGTFARKDA
ncbi:hypothetical protein [Undibacterium sp. Tian12W]|uniref:hypothetical protein n=1 Tax=Undibacterium sp. Tian12W TaxID=3413054 RepID=UPI003BF1FC59